MNLVILNQFAIFSSVIKLHISTFKLSSNSQGSLPFIAKFINSYPILASLHILELCLMLEKAKISGRSTLFVADKRILYIIIFYLLLVQSTINREIYANLVVDVADDCLKNYFS